MSYIITGVVCLLVGFVAGLLVYRKHGKKAEAEAAEWKSKFEAIKKATKG